MKKVQRDRDTDHKPQDSPLVGTPEAVGELLGEADPAVVLTDDHGYAIDHRPEHEQHDEQIHPSRIRIHSTLQQGFRKVFWYILYTKI